MISKKKSRQEFIPPLGKFVNLIKAEPLHNTNNAWQQWFTTLLTVVMQHTDNSQLQSGTTLPDMPDALPLIKFLTYLRDTAKCSRLYNSFQRWFGKKRKKGISFSYRFTGLESKNFPWNFPSLIQSCQFQHYCWSADSPISLATRCLWSAMLNRVSKYRKVLFLPLASRLGVRSGIHNVKPQTTGAQACGQHE